MSTDFVLDWRLDPSWKGAGRDWSEASETVLRYDAFLGNLLLRSDGVALDAMWGRIPLLDLAVGLDAGARELASTGPGQVSIVGFTESEAEIRFERRVNTAEITASYAPGAIEVPLTLLLPLMRGFLDELCRQLAADHATLLDNPWFRALRHWPDPDSVQFVHVLVAGIPGAEEVLRSHVDDNDEVLPHVLLGDLMPWLVDELDRPGSRAVVQEIVNRFETGFATGPPLVDELVAVSFLESLPRPGERGAELRTLLGPRCAAHVEECSL